MATTTNYGWTTPDDTALVKDGASAIRTLGSSVDTTTKNLNPETTLGDISFRSSTSNVNTRLGIGGTGTVLTVAAGVPSWATPASSSPASETATVATEESTTSTSYTDLTTAGPAVTITTGTKALVIITSTLINMASSGPTMMDFAISGATTRAATDATALSGFRDTVNATQPGMHMSAATYTTVTAGSNTFTAKYKSGNGNNRTYKDRSIIVIDLGS